MSGERIVLVGEAKYGTLSERHEALKDRGGPKAGFTGALEKIEAYVIEAGTIDRRELRKRTNFFSADQQNHIEEEAKAAWSLMKPRKIDGVSDNPFIREGRHHITLQHSFRDLVSGKFVKRPKREEK